MGHFGSKKDSGSCHHYRDQQHHFSETATVTVPVIALPVPADNKAALNIAVISGVFLLGFICMCGAINFRWMRSRQEQEIDDVSKYNAWFYFGHSQPFFNASTQWVLGNSSSNTWILFQGRALLPQL